MPESKMPAKGAGASGGGADADEGGGLRRDTVDVLITLAVLSGLVIALFTVAVFVTRRSGQWRGMWWFLNGDARFSVSGFVLGLIPGAVFGFIDQMSLWITLRNNDKPMTFSNRLGSVLGPVLPDGQLTREAWGNTVSDTVGTMCAVIVAKIVSTSSGKTEYPMYSEVIGVFLGCLAGIYIPRVVTARA